MTQTQAHRASRSARRDGGRGGVRRHERGRHPQRGGDENRSATLTGSSSAGAAGASQNRSKRCDRRNPGSAQADARERKPKRHAGARRKPPDRRPEGRRCYQRSVGVGSPAMKRWSAPARRQRSAASSTCQPRPPTSTGYRVRHVSLVVPGAARRWVGCRARTSAGARGLGARGDVRIKDGDESRGDERGAVRASGDGDASPGAAPVTGTVNVADGRGRAWALLTSNTPARNRAPCVRTSGAKPLTLSGRHTR